MNRRQLAALVAACLTLTGCAGLDRATSAAPGGAATATSATPTAASGLGDSVKDGGDVPVNDVGERAFLLAGHLYVLYGTMSIDIYSRGDSDAENLAEATAVAQAVIPQI